MGGGEKGVEGLREMFEFHNNKLLTIYMYIYINMFFLHVQSTTWTGPQAPKGCSGVPGPLRARVGHTESTPSGDQGADQPRNNCGPET